MITQEEFEAIVNKVKDGQNPTTEEGSALIQTIAELDQQVAIAEGIVSFVLEAVEQIYEEAADETLKRIQIRDLSKVKDIRQISKKASARLTALVELYVAQVVTQLQSQSAVADADPNILDNQDPA